MTDVVVRDMRITECERVSEIRVRGWQSAYRGLMPQSFLDALSVPADAAHRRDRFARGDAGVVDLVAERDGHILGWACHGPYRSDEPPTDEPPTKDAELYALYVDPKRFGSGVGHALLQESVRLCTAARHRRMYLWVLKGNARARAFYERAGFRADGTEEPFEVDGVPVPEVRYVRELTG